jgi:hypothetical protein
MRRRSSPSIVRKCRKSFEEKTMKIPPSTLKLMLISAGAVGLAAGVHAATAPQTGVEGITEISAEPVVKAAPAATPTPKPSPKPSQDPCPACGMG